MCIKLHPSLARLWFRKCVTLQPARDRSMAYPYLLGDGCLREAKLPSGYDVLVLSQALLSPRLAQFGSLRPHFRHLSGLRRFQRRGSGLLGLVGPLHSQMTCQDPLESLSQIFYQVEPVRATSWLGERNFLPQKQSRRRDPGLPARFLGVVPSTRRRFRPCGQVRHR